MKRGNEMKQLTAGLLFFILATTLGCSGMNNTQQKTLSGAGIGAGSGAVLGTITGGSAVTGAVVGGGIGAATGYILGESDKK